LNIAGILIIITLLSSPKPVNEVETVNVTVVLKVSPWDPLARSFFNVYVNGSPVIHGTELKVNPSGKLVFRVPKGSYLWITGESGGIGGYGFFGGLLKNKKKGGFTRLKGGRGRSASV